MNNNKLLLHFLIVKECKYQPNKNFIIKVIGKHNPLLFCNAIIPKKAAVPDVYGLFDLASTIQTRRILRCS